MLARNSLAQVVIDYVWNTYNHHIHRSMAPYRFRVYTRNTLAPRNSPDWDRPRRQGSDAWVNRAPSDTGLGTSRVISSCIELSCETSDYRTDFTNEPPVHEVSRARSGLRGTFSFFFGDLKSSSHMKRSIAIVLFKQHAQYHRTDHLFSSYATYGAIELFL